MAQGQIQEMWWGVREQGQAKKSIKGSNQKNFKKLLIAWKIVKKGVPKTKNIAKIVRNSAEELQDKVQEITQKEQKKTKSERNET